MCFDGVSQDHIDEPDCNLASRDSGVPATFSEEVSHLSIRMNKQTFIVFFCLHFFTVQHGKSCSGENRLECSPSGSNGDAKEPLESEGMMFSQENDDNEGSSLDDDDDEEDAELTKKLNK